MMISGNRKQPYLLAGIALFALSLALVAPVHAHDDDGAEHACKVCKTHHFAALDTTIGGPATVPDPTQDARVHTRTTPPRDRSVAVPPLRGPPTA